MTVGAAVGWASLSVVTFIVAMKTLGVGRCRRFQEKARKDLSRGGDNPMSRRGSLGVGIAKESVFLRESRFRNESGSRRGWSGGDPRGEGKGGRTWTGRDAGCEGRR